MREMVQSGLTRREVADTFGVSTRTVSVHRGGRGLYYPERMRSREQPFVIVDVT